jgi:hypothetical protein
VLGQMRGTLTFNRSLLLHTSIVAISLYYSCIRAIYNYLAFLLFKSYVATAIVLSEISFPIIIVSI